MQLSGTLHSFNQLRSRANLSSAVQGVAGGLLDGLKLMTAAAILDQVGPSDSDALQC